MESHVPGSVWKLLVKAGASVKRGDPLVIVESMKMEVVIEASHDGTIEDLTAVEGKAVLPGQRLALLRPEAP